MQVLSLAKKSLKAIAFKVTQAKLILKFMKKILKSKGVMEFHIPKIAFLEKLVPYIFTLNI